MLPDVSVNELRGKRRSQYPSPEFSPSLGKLENEARNAFAQEQQDEGLQRLLHISRARPSGSATPANLSTWDLGLQRQQARTSRSRLPVSMARDRAVNARHQKSHTSMPSPARRSSRSSEAISVHGGLSASSTASSQTLTSSAGHWSLIDLFVAALTDSPKFTMLCSSAQTLVSYAELEGKLAVLLTHYGLTLRESVTDALDYGLASQLVNQAPHIARQAVTQLVRAGTVTEDIKQNTDSRYSPAVHLYQEDATATAPSTDLHAHFDCAEDSAMLLYGQVQNVLCGPGFEGFLNRLSESIFSKRHGRRFSATCDLCEELWVTAEHGILHGCSSARPEQASLPRSTHTSHFEKARWRCLFYDCWFNVIPFKSREELRAHVLGHHDVDDYSYTCCSVECGAHHFWLNEEDYNLHCKLEHTDSDVNTYSPPVKQPVWGIWSSDGYAADLPGHLQPPRPAEQIRTRVHSPLTLLLSHVRNLIDDLRGTPPQPGFVRVAYQCSCGRRVSDDYRQLYRGGIDELRRILSRMEARGLNARKTQESQGEDSESSSRPNAFAGALDWLRSFHTRQRSINTTTLPQHTPHKPTIVSSTSTAPTLGTSSNHLVLVLPHMKRASRVHQPSSDFILSDQSFFTALSEQYKSVRGSLRGRFSWRSLSDMRFIKFDMLRSGLAQVQKLDDIPPLHSEDYQYEPVSWSPPIGPQLLLHLMEHPQHAEPDQVLFKRVPKKLRQRLEACPVSGHADGWGIQYIEDVDKERVCAVLFVCAIISIVLALTWTICKKDVQGGFTIAGTMFVILSTGIGAAETALGTQSSMPS